jgi:hypothetical protein
VTDVDKYSHFVPFCVCVPASQPSALSAALTQTAHALPPSSASRVTRRLTPRAFEAELAVGFQLLRRVDQPLLAASLTLRAQSLAEKATFLRRVREALGCAPHERHSDALFGCHQVTAVSPESVTVASGPSRIFDWLTCSWRVAHARACVRVLWLSRARAGCAGASRRGRSQAVVLLSLPYASPARRRCTGRCWSAALRRLRSARSALSRRGAGSCTAHNRTGYETPRPRLGSRPQPEASFCT